MYNYTTNSNNDNINPINGSQGFDSGFAATLPFDKITIPKKTIAVDSRQRNTALYPSPSKYKIDLGDLITGVTSLELKCASLPRSSYNVHNGNNTIYFSIGSTITSIKLTHPGNNYTSVPQVTISAPLDSPSIQATAIAILDTSTKRISSIAITNPGQGYRTGIPPTVQISGQTVYNSSNILATAIAEVGTRYTAKLRPGQYIIGGNTPSGLIKEIQNAMNFQVNGTYNPASTSPFEVRLVSQYPEINATAGEPESFDTNATLYNRIQIINVNSDHWELSFKNRLNSAQNILGFPSIDQTDPTPTPAIAAVMSAGTSIRSLFDYDLNDDPKYIVLSFSYEAAFERIISGNSSLNRKFGTMVFDANPTDVVKDTIGTSTTVSGVKYLTGTVEKGTFWAAPGTLKALKGTDFDNKKITFAAPIGKLTTLEIEFTCFGQYAGGEKVLYDFQGRDHLLIFEVSSGDQSFNMK